jgi:DNA-binding IclR family transcriptional regulator
MRLAPGCLTAVILGLGAGQDARQSQVVRDADTPAPVGATVGVGVRSERGRGNLWEVARPYMERLVGQTQESSSIAQLDGSDIIYVARVAVPKIVALAVTVGTRFPAMPTSLGKVLLAAMPPSRQPVEASL